MDSRRHVSAADQRWPWWPLLPLYPYGRKRTLVREIIPDQLWSFEQLQGVFYVAVPIRMTVARVRGGLLLYAAVAPTAEVRQALRDLEARFGPIQSIVLPTASGLEHKLPLPSLARAFPKAQLWVTPGQWSFPLNLPLPWLGFPAQRTKVLGDDGYPHPEEFRWLPLGPLDLGLGRFQEFAGLHQASGALLLTDALVAINEQPPELFELDPTPLLFHARDLGDQPLLDRPDLRQKGWERLALFASFLRPEALEVPPLAALLQRAFRPGCRSPRSYFGIYPFQWSCSSAEAFAELQAQSVDRLLVAPVLERLVFPRAKPVVVRWLRELSRWQEVRWIVPAHYDAPVPSSPEALERLASAFESRPWAPEQGNWTYLAGLDALLVRTGVVPNQPIN